MYVQIYDMSFTSTFVEDKRNSDEDYAGCNEIHSEITIMAHKELDKEIINKLPVLIVDYTNRDYDGYYNYFYHTFGELKYQPLDVLEYRNYVYFKFVLDSFIDVDKDGYMLSNKDKNQDAIEVIKLAIQDIINKVNK